MSARPPRIRPGNLRDLGLVNGLLARALGAASGGPPPNIFLTLGRHRSLFRKWLLFAGGLMPGVIDNIQSAREAIRVAVEKAEQACGMRILSAVVGISGGHISSQNNRGIIAIPDRSRAITEDDRSRVLDSAGQATTIDV